MNKCAAMLIVLFVLLFSASMFYELSPGDEPIKYSFPEPPLAMRQLADFVLFEFDAQLVEDDLNILISAGIIVEPPFDQSL